MQLLICATQPSILDHFLADFPLPRMQEKFSNTSGQPLVPPIGQGWRLLFIEFCVSSKLNCQLPLLLEISRLSSVTKLPCHPT